MADYWEIHYAIIDSEGKELSRGRYVKTYKRKGYAKRIAKQRWGDKHPCFKDCRYNWWLVGRTYEGGVVNG